MSNIVELIDADRIYWQEGHGFKLALVSVKFYILDFSEYNGENNIVHVKQSPQEILKEVLSPESLYLRKLHNDRVNYYSQQQDEYYNRTHDTTPMTPTQIEARNKKVKEIIAKSKNRDNEKDKS